MNNNKLGKEEMNQAMQLADTYHIMAKKHQDNPEMMKKINNDYHKNSPLYK